MNLENLRIGTCSWNYACWVGLVYSQKYRTASEYLKEYASIYRTVEIDSFFYRIPSIKDVLSYKAAVDNDFTFTIKAPQELTLTHLRSKDSVLQINDKFLSADLYRQFVDRLEPLSGNITAVMLEFEYLNKGKMPSLGQFLKVIDSFVSATSGDLPLAIETRNANFLCEEYFAFLKEKNIIHVFSEKQYLPPITSLYEKYSSFLIDSSIIRLLGGDRAAIEKRTGENWNAIVEEKTQKSAIVEMVRDLLSEGKKVTLNVNNHFEGCAPLTIKEIEKLLM